MRGFSKIEKSKGEIWEFYIKSYKTEDLLEGDLQKRSVKEESKGEDFEGGGTGLNY